MAIIVQGMAPLLQVFDMPSSIAFYRDKTWFEVSNPTHDDVDWVLLKFNGGELMLNTAYEKDARPAEADLVRIAVMLIQVYTLVALMSMRVHRTLQQGLDIESPVITHYGIKLLR
jgi:hypothetical protein